MASIEKRSSNSWRLIVEAGYDANGKRKKKSMTIKVEDLKLLKSPKKLDEFLNDELYKFKMKVAVGTYYSPEKMTFSAFVEEWKENYARNQLGANTLEGYLIHLNNRIIPAMGHLRLDQIKPIQVINFISSLEKAERKDGQEGSLSSGTIEYIYRVLKNVFNRAVDWKIIENSPMASIKKPKAKHTEMSVFDVEEAQLLYVALENEPVMWRVMIVLALTTGMRRGELLGLEWKHVDLEKGTIDIRQNLIFVKEEGYLLKEPKTKNSVRKIAISPLVIPDLKALKIQSGKERMKSGELWKNGERFFVFSSWNGKPLYPSSVKTWWGRFIKRHNLRYIRFHDLRHTSATLLINAGKNIKSVSARLGHANTSTTLNIYTHALQSADFAAAEQFDEILQPKQKKDNRETV